MQENPESNPESDNDAESIRSNRRFFIKKSSASILGVTLVDLIGGALPAFAITPDDVDTQCKYKKPGEVWHEGDMDSTCGQQVVPPSETGQGPYNDPDQACGSDTNQANKFDSDGNCQNDNPTANNDADESCNTMDYTSGQVDSDQGCKKMNGTQADQDNYCGMQNNKADDTCNMNTRQWDNAGDGTCGNLIVPTPDSAIRDPDEQCVNKHTIFAGGVNEDGNCGREAGTGPAFEPDSGCNTTSQGTDPDQWCQKMHAAGATQAADQSLQ